MRRREFITLVATGATAAWPLVARAQQAERVRRIGILISAREDDPDGHRRVALLRQGLSELGWTEGRNIHIDYRWVGGDAARAKTAATELVSQKPDVIVANSTLFACCSSERDQYDTNRVCGCRRSDWTRLRP
jgi:putative ABC transport system substrate-binding protein